MRDGCYQSTGRRQPLGAAQRFFQFVVQLADLFFGSLRSVTSRIAPVTNVPFSVASGLKLISTGNSLPSLRSPNSSRPDAHRSHMWFGKKVGAMPRMQAAIAFRDQHLDTLAQQLGAGVAEELFGLRVYQRDLALIVHNNHGVGRSFQQRAEFFFGLFAHCDIPYCARDQDTVGSLDRAKTDLERKFRTIFSQSKKLQLFSHRPLARIAKIGGTVVQDGDRESAQGCSTSTGYPSNSCREYPNNSSVRELISTIRAALIDNNHRVGRRLQQGLETCPPSLCAP